MLGTMPILLEKFILPIFVGVLILVAITNPMGWDWQRRTSLGLALCFGAWFVAILISRPKAAVPTSQRAALLVSTMDFRRPKDAPLSNIPLVADTPFVLEVSFVSKGPVSADKIGMFALIGIASETAEKADQENIWQKVRKLADGNGSGDVSLYPGKEATADFQYPLPKSSDPPITQDDIDQIKAGTKRIVFAAIFKYQDEHGSIETQHCQSYSGVSWQYWVTCYGHNKIIAVND
jgi:hypothetical protein